MSTWQKPPLGAQLIYKDPGLVAHWLMNDNGPPLSDIHDYSGNGNTGTMVGDTHFVPGKFGPVLLFNGTSDFVLFGSIFTPGVSDFFISAWIKLNIPSASGNPCIVARGSVDVGDWMFRVRDGDTPNDTRLSFFGSAGAISAEGANGSILDGVWYHVAVVRTNGIITLYQDGQSIATDATASSDLNALDNLRIGDADNLDRLWDGLIDNVQIGNRSITASGIKQLYLYPYAQFRRDWSEVFLVGIATAATVATASTAKHKRIEPSSNATPFIVNAFTSDASAAEEIKAAPATGQIVLNQLSVICLVPNTTVTIGSGQSGGAVTTPIWGPMHFASTESAAGYITGVKYTWKFANQLWLPAATPLVVDSGADGSVIVTAEGLVVV